MSDETQKRKDAHLDLCFEKDVSSAGTFGFENIRIPHCALPDINFDKISLSTQFLGREISAPLLISSMTGGSDRGESLNQVLAEFAQKAKIPMGVGSQRVALETKNKELFSLRKKAPDALFLANIGAVQLNYGVSVDDCHSLVEQLQAQALILHLNPLQEAIQKEGDRNFSGLWIKIEELCKKLPVPVILKETGCGLDIQTSRRALEVGVKVLDVAGFGGTHWGYIEGLRHKDQEQLGTTFRSWGLSTKDSVEAHRKNLGWNFPLIASGGIRNGLDVAKALYLGADLVGLALPFLKAAEKGATALDQLYTELTQALRVALFCSDSPNIEALRLKGKRIHYENKSH